MTEDLPNNKLTPIVVNCSPKSDNQIHWIAFLSINVNYENSIDSGY